jgi:uncharacterized phage protein (TIGR01671 family)
MGEFKMLYVKELSWSKHDDGVVRMHFGADVEFGNTGSSVHSGFGKSDGSEDYGWRLMQYSESKDKNNIELYEGDIIKGYIPDSEDDIEFSVGVVKFEEGCFNVWTSNNEYLGDLYSCVINKSIEIIGNIYEKPELLIV